MADDKLMNMFLRVLDNEWIASLETRCLVTYPEPLFIVFLPKGDDKL